MRSVPFVTPNTHGNDDYPEQDACERQHPIRVNALAQQRLAHKPPVHKPPRFQRAGQSVAFVPGEFDHAVARVASRVQQRVYGQRPVVPGVYKVLQRVVPAARLGEAQRTDRSTCRHDESRLVRKVRQLLGVKARDTHACHHRTAPLVGIKPHGDCSGEFSPPSPH